MEAWFSFVDTAEAAALPLYSAFGFSAVAHAELLPSPADVVGKAVLRRRGSWIYTMLQHAETSPLGPARITLARRLELLRPVTSCRTMSFVTTTTDPTSFLNTGYFSRRL